MSFDDASSHGKLFNTDEPVASAAIFGVLISNISFPSASCPSAIDLEGSRCPCS